MQCHSTAAAGRTRPNAAAWRPAETRHSHVKPSHIIAGQRQILRVVGSAAVHKIGRAGNAGNPVAHASHDAQTACRPQHHGAVAGRDDPGAGERAVHEDARARADQGVADRPKRRPVTQCLRVRHHLRDGKIAGEQCTRFECLKRRSITAAANRGISDTVRWEPPPPEPVHSCFQDMPPNFQYPCQGTDRSRSPTQCASCSGPLQAL